MANRGWDSRNHHSNNNNTPIACRLCSQVFPNKETFISHIDSHLARNEVLHNNHGSNNNIQAHPKASQHQREMAFHPHHHQQLAVVMHNNLPTLRPSLVPSNVQQADRNVFETRPEVVNRNVLETRPNPLPPSLVPPEANRNGFDARSLMQKVTRNGFNNLPLMVQQGNNNHGVHVANNPGPSSMPPPARRNPSLLTYVPPSAPVGGSLQQPAQLGISSIRTRNASIRGRRRTQQRNVEMVASATIEQTTRPFIDLLDVPIKKVDFIDLENMDVDDDSSGSRKKKLDLELKL